jgi:hypothetical protein
MGIVFGLYLAFTAAQVWGDINRANAAVNREANALSAIVILAASFPGESEQRMRELLRRYIENTAAKEWPTICLLLVIAMIHNDNRGSSAIAMGLLFATGVAVAVLLIATHNRPFTGEILVGPEPLLQVLPEKTTS